MKRLIHVQRDTSICIYNLNSKNITGSFFKEKPEVGDVVMSWTARESNFLRMFHVKEVRKNRDAKMNPMCRYNPTNAFFSLSVEEVTEDKDFSEIDNSIDNIR